jgi:alkylated DNA repair protein alkB family protein 8
VFVCDALQLCYRPCSCDALLCIAVLHHISSRQRRVALLQQLADVLRPGGRGLVTVWASQQEDPGKTIKRWHKMQPAADGQGQLQGAETPPQQLQEVDADAADAADAVVQLEPGQPLGAAAEGPDYFVPWHLPFHRAGGLAAQAQAQQQAGTCCSGGTSSSSKVADGSKGPAAVAVDESKGAVVLQRYYHLFEQGELESLVAHVPGLKVSQVFYDRSNWCVEFVKEAAGSC